MVLMPGSEVSPATVSPHWIGPLWLLAVGAMVGALVGVHVSPTAVGALVLQSGTILTSA